MPYDVCICNTKCRKGAWHVTWPCDEVSATETRLSSEKDSLSAVAVGVDDFRLRSDRYWSRLGQLPKHRKIYDRCGIEPIITRSGMTNLVSLWSSKFWTRCCTDQALAAPGELILGLAMPVGDLSTEGIERGLPQKLRRIEELAAGLSCFLASSCL